MPKDVLDAGVRNAGRRGFKNSFSAYIAWLIERDHEGNVERESLRIAEEPPPLAAKRKQEPPPQSDNEES